MAIHTRIILSTIVLLNFAVIVSASPSCSKNELDQSRFIWYSCGTAGNTNKWYGVSLISDTLDAAKSACDEVSNSYKTELLWIGDQNVDICAYYALKLYAGGKDYSVVSSLQKFGYTVWQWCPGNSNIEMEVCVDPHPMGYTNWGIGEPRDGQYCMEVHVEKGAKSFGDYNWKTKDCGELMYSQNRFMCVVDCDDKG